MGAEGSTLGPQPQKHLPSSSSDVLTFVFLTVSLYQDDKGCVLQSSHHSDVRQCWKQSGVLEVASEDSSEGPLL